MRHTPSQLALMISLIGVGAAQNAHARFEVGVPDDQPMSAAEIESPGLADDGLPLRPMTSAMYLVERPAARPQIVYRQALRTPHAPHKHAAVPRKAAVTAAPSKARAAVQAKAPAEARAKASTGAHTKVVAKVPAKAKAQAKAQSTPARTQVVAQGKAYADAQSVAWTRAQDKSLAKTRAQARSDAARAAQDAQDEALAQAQAQTQEQAKEALRARALAWAQAQADALALADARAQTKAIERALAQAKAKAEADAAAVEAALEQARIRTPVPAVASMPRPAPEPVVTEDERNERVVESTSTKVWRDLERVVSGESRAVDAGAAKSAQADKVLDTLAHINAVRAPAAAESGDVATTSPIVAATTRPVADSAQVDIELDLSPPAAAQPAPSPFGGEKVAVSEASLGEIRGGFVGDGLSVSFGIERAVYINGNLVTSTRLNVTDLGAASGGRVVGDLNPAALTLVQNGVANTVVNATVGSNAVGTLIQNTLDGQKIQNLTVINATANSMGVLRGMNLQSSLRGAVIDSLRR